MNIALFGGAFDPPHLGHQQVVNSLLTNHIVDEVWFLPVKQHAFGKQLQVADEHRLAMLQLIQQPGTKVELYELENDEISLSYVTLRALSQRYPMHTFSFVIGTDNLADFHKWDFYEEMLQEFRFYVYPRAGFPFEPLRDGMVALHDMPAIAVSSTDIRYAIAHGDSIDHLVDPAIAAYIADNQLYR